MTIDPANAVSPNRMFLMQKTLRIVILIEIFFTAAGIISEYGLKSLLPEDLRNYVSPNQSSVMVMIPSVFLILVLLLLIVSWMQLWRLKPDGRILYSVAWGCSLPLVIPLGPFIQSGLTYTLSTISTLAGGVILGILYFSDLRSRFR